MERAPVDSSLVAIHDSLDLDFIASVATFLRLALTGSGGILLPEVAVVPKTQSLVQRAGDDEVLVGVELCTHDVVAVSSEDGEL
jgi:hypothetical protein